MKVHFVGLIATAMAVFASVSLCGCASECSKWQPGANPREGSGIPGPGPVSFGNRVVYGQVLKEPSATWNSLGTDVYFHIKASPSLVLTPEQQKSAAEGTRVLMGPFLNSTTYAAIRSVPLLNSSGEVTHDLCAQVSTGYAALWGWRPYIRLQRISAAAEGTQIIGQVKSSSPTSVVERVYLVENNSGSPVYIRELSTGTIKATLTVPNTYVELTTVVQSSGTVTAAGPVQNTPTGDAFVASVKAKMN